jgi:basic membrane protein A
MRAAFCLALALVVLVCACGESGDRGGSGALRVGLVFDIGGRGDKSFNDSAYRGLEQAQRDLGIDFEYLEPVEGADRETGLREYASRSFDLVIGVGFMFTSRVSITR